MSKIIVIGNIHNNLELEDLPNEKWIDGFEFDGIYEVSNLGRIKHLQHEAQTRWGTPYIVEEKVSKQTVVRKGKNGRIEGLTVYLGKSRSSPKFIFQSFFPEVDFQKNECVMHVNKKCLDNRIENLKKVSRKKSKETDMIKSIRTIISTPKNLEKAKETNKEFYDNRTHKECSKCGKIDLVENFTNDKSKCNECINYYVRDRRKKYKYKNEVKTCNVCNVEKKDIEFPKLDNICKKCRYDLNKIYKAEQRKTLGDSYVKQWGKFTYGYKEFNQKLIDELRNELKEKRKPKHILDNKNFRTTRDFAKYILCKYKIPVTTVEKRIFNGRTEFECSLNRKQFVLHNKKKHK